MELIREGDWFTCNIDGIDYKCCVDTSSGWYVGPRITVTIKKYLDKKFWKFRYKSLEFEYDITFDFSYVNAVKIKGYHCFHPEYLRELIDRTIYHRNYDVRHELEKEEFESNVKIITKI